ncbi:MaoC family dehydratase [Desulfatiferula olefinivorans]
MIYFEDIVVGERTRVGHYDLTEEDILAYARTWDPHETHIDPETAKKTVFQGLTAAGTHLMAVTVRLMVTSPTPIHTLAGLGWDEVRFLSPGRPGYTLTLYRTCIGKRPSASRPGCGIVKNRLELVNQDGLLLVSYLDTVLVALAP